MCYLYLKFRVFLERKVQPKSVLKGVVSFIYSIEQGFTTREFTLTRFAYVNSTRKLDSRTRTSLPKIKIK